MPTNVPPQYHEAEARLRQAKTREEKLAILEEMMAIMPKHKGTDKLRSELNQRIKKLKEAQEKEKRGATRKAVYVPREGAGQIVLIGPPNGGKSQLLCALTNATPEVASYPFTTRIPVPGMMPFEDIKIQLIEVPAITASSMEIWAPEIIRSADLAVIVVDLSSSDLLDSVEAVKNQLEKHYIFLIKDNPEERKIGATYLNTIIFANKVDLTEAKENLQIFQEWVGNRYDVFVFSALNDDDIKKLPAILFEKLRIIRIYTKAPGKKLEKQDPLILPVNSTVLDAAAALHKEIAKKLKYARVWGEGVRDGQQIARDEVLKDKWALEFHTA